MAGPDAAPSTAPLRAIQQCVPPLVVQQAVPGGAERQPGLCAPGEPRVNDLDLLRRLACHSTCQGVMGRSSAPLNNSIHLSHGLVELVGAAGEDGEGVGRGVEGAGRGEEFAGFEVFYGGECLAETVFGEGEGEPSLLGVVTLEEALLAVDPVAGRLVPTNVLRL